MNGTKVKTPSGDVNIEDLVVGDKVFGADGKPHSVTGVYPQGKKRVYNVVFSDGTVIPSSDDHLWNIQTASMRNNNRGFKTVTLRDIIDNYDLYKENASGSKRWNVYIPMSEPVVYDKQELPMEPYLLGALIGDGYLRDNGGNTFSNPEKDIICKVDTQLNKIGWRLTKYDNETSDYGLTAIDYRNKEYQGTMYLTDTLKELGLHGKKSYEKFIPEIYLKSDIEER